MSARYEFIDAEKVSTDEHGLVKYPIVKMCEWLEVSTSGFYEWVSRPMSATAQRREYLKLLIVRAFHDSDGTYVYRRLHAQLVRWGEGCSAELVRALSRQLGLVACQPRPWRHSLTESGPSGPIPDLVRRDFSADTPGTKMVGDITYIPTWQGWLFLATVIDCCTKAVIGWAMDDNYRTPLISAAIDMAARNHNVASKAIFHSDRGSNYHSIHQRRIRRPPPLPPNARFDGASRAVLGQRTRRILLRFAEERVDLPYRVPHPEESPPGGCRIHRSLLQS